MEGATEVIPACGGKARRTLRDWLTRLARPGGTQMLKVHQPGQLPSPAAQLPPLRLPPQPGRRFTIGRAMACDFTLEDQWLLSDLGSTNGTRLNGWRVTTGVPVKSGDQVSFGSISFVITDRPIGTD